MNVENYLIKLGLNYTEKSNSFLITCPYHNDTHPSMSIYKNTGMCVCYACGVRKHITAFIKDRDSTIKIDDNDYSFKGFNTVRKEQVDKVDRSISKVTYPKGYELLSHDLPGWGLTPEMIKYFKIGYCKYGFKDSISEDLCEGCYFFDKYSDKKRWVTDSGFCWFSMYRFMIPTESKGMLYDLESRDTTGKSAKKMLCPHESKGAYIIFNNENLSTRKPLYAVEGRKSCLRLWRDIDHNATAIFSNRIKPGQIPYLKRFKHIVIIPDNGDAGKLMITDFLKLEIPNLEIVRLPEVLLCKGCGYKFRGKEKMDICPQCKQSKVSYMDAFDFSTDLLKNLIKNREKLTNHSNFIYAR